MRRTAFITTPLIRWQALHKSPSFLHIFVARKYSSNAKEAKNNTLWTFLWGSGKQQDVKQPLSQPTASLNILDYKVRTSDVSPFEYVYINTQEKLEATVKYLQQQQLLAIDCEGVGLSREGKLCLIQIGTDNMVFLIDVIVLGSASFSSGIGKLLEDPKITKVMHDCRADSDALFYQHNIKLDGVYDVQIAHSLHEKKHKWERKKRASLQSISQTHLRLPWVSKFVEYKREMKKYYQKEPEAWKKRPLPQLLINYACGDVKVLIPLYHTFIKRFNTVSDKQYISRGNKSQVSAMRDNNNNNNDKSSPPPAGTYELI